MLGEDFEIKKYPYMSFSPNLMEYFCIIGYQDNFIPELIESLKKYKNKNIYSPTILSSINSNIDYYGMIDNELIISQVYPDNPLIIPINKNDPNIETPSRSNVIYSFCIDNIDGKSKVIYTCFAYKFCEKYKMKNTMIDYYIPKAFCIISQYPFFCVFENICKNIHFLMTRDNNYNVPIELIVYNIVNFTPSPKNYCLQLDIFSFCMEVPKIELKQLSGYPYIDFDLKEIFNILSINFFLEVYLFTVIEQCMLFFSSNLELLNMVMYTMYILNYPCNDSKYFWHIVSVSKNEIKSDNKFVGKVMAKLLGVNAAYDESIDTFPFERYHYIIDLDNKKIFLRQSPDLSIDENNNIDSLNNLQSYIQNIIKEKNVESSFLKPFIIKLKRGLEKIIDNEQIPASTIKNSKSKNIFRMDKNIYNTNRKIQEIFYDFFLNVLMIFYPENSLDNDFSKIQKVECSIEKYNLLINNFKINDKKIDMTEEEQSFCEFFRLSIKYDIYFDNFLRNLEGVDIFKIALLFSDEFINIKMNDVKNSILNNVSLFNIIDNLYIPSRQQTINITINNLFSFCPEKIRNYFEEYIVDYKYIKPQLINFNKNIIKKYIYMLNNSFERIEIFDLFGSIRIQEEQIISIDRRYIINIIQNKLEGFIETKDYLIYGYIYIFCITMSLHPYNQLILYIGDIIKCIFKIDYFLRQYFYIILQSLYKYLIINKKKQIYPQFRPYSIRMYYSMLLSCLKQNFIIPNEEIMSILANIFGKKNNLEDKYIHEENAEKNNEEYFEIKKNVNFLCFMKHCFDNKKYYNSNTMILSALRQKNNCNIIIKQDTIKKSLKPTIEIKIKDYIYSSEFFSPKKIFKLSATCHTEFYETNKMDFSKLKINDIRNCLANLIQYGLELKDIPVKYFIHTLYLLRNYEEKYQKKKV